MRAQAGEVYTVYNQYLKRYTACQVAYIAPPDTVSKESWAVVLSLDWVGDAPLTAEELPHLRPLYKDFMYWSRDLHLLRVPLEVPPQYKLVGTLPPFTDQPCRSYPELKMLVDAVASSKVISAKKSQALIQKLGQLTSIQQAEQLQRLASLSSRVKPHNEKVYYIIDSIQTAILDQHQISFQYYEYTPEKKKILKHDG